MALSVLIYNPPAGNITPTSGLVFESTSLSSINFFRVFVTNSTGAVVPVYDSGFVAPFSGTVTPITNGNRVTVNCPFGWPVGLLSISVTAKDVSPATATASRSWTVIFNGTILIPPVPGEEYASLVSFIDGGRPFVVEPLIV